MQGFWRFLTYNNAVPIAITLVLSGAGATFAATNPEAIYNTAQTVVAVDNTYLANKDLDAFTPSILILGVTEDTDNYYVAYRLTTIDVVDSVWQDVVKDDVLTVAKGLLGENGDLGRYTSAQFKQVVDRQVAYLKEVQEIERRQISHKVVATAYSGLIGQLLNESTEELPGYIPVTTPPVHQEIPPNNQGENPSQENGGAPSGSTTAPSGPSIQLLGDATMHIALGTTYTDLGVVITDSHDDSPPPPKVFIDGVEVQGKISLDTSTARTYVIRYKATDENGNSNSVTREVIVDTPSAGGGSSEPEAPASTTPTTTPQTTPEPAPSPAPEPAATSSMPEETQTSTSTQP